MTHRLTALALAVLLVAAACGGDDGADASGPELPAWDPPTTTTEPPRATLTNLAVDDPERRDRPVLAVKIDNHNRDARPQSGIAVADVVYEEIVEGGATRFVALFHAADADPVGPIRSARGTDISILAPLNRPLFAWSGSNAQTAAEVRRAPLVDVGFDARSGEYQRRPGRRAPNNLYSTTDALRRHTPDDAAPPPRLFHFRSEDALPPLDAEPVAGVRINYGGSVGLVVEYAWDRGERGWARTQAGTPHVDESGERVAPQNVIVQFVDYVNTAIVDSAGAPVPEAVLVGEGEAWIFTDGRLIRGRWQRGAASEVTRYLDADGRPVSLTPGRTWIALPRPGSATVLGATPDPS